MNKSDDYLKELERRAKWANTTNQPIPLGKCCVGGTKKMWSLEFTWWGRNQWYKWRWHRTHIDLGMLSIYDLPQKGPGRWFWRFISILIKPMRWLYHRRFRRKFQ